jgi:ribosomal protein S18 acetylase RimI-like enzyme
MVDIRLAALPEDLGVIRELFLEYSRSLDIDLCFQQFDDELDSLPGKYAPPHGRLILAWDNDQPVGCVALRAVQPAVGEMKRLYVRPEARARRLGHRLAERLIEEARQAGYRRIVLDTLPTMSPAIALYSKLGFRPTEAYTFNPIDGALFLGLDL